MKISILLSTLLLSVVSAENVTNQGSIERIETLFGKDNLVAWCIVPFDSMNRRPEARAKLLNELGLSRCAYDWRTEHVPQFEEEILQYQKHDIEFTAFWRTHDTAVALFKKHGLAPQIWQTLKTPKTGTNEEKLAAAVKEILPLVEQTRAMGSKLSLYNHGGWGGEPANMVAVCQFLREKHDAGHVGIVYNFHHGHGDIAEFEHAFQVMLPYLHCVNLNGMTDPAQLTAATKILPLGSGVHESDMVQVVLDSGYDGPIGILGHIKEQDVKISLQNNLDGLQKIKRKLRTTP